MNDLGACKIAWRVRSAVVQLGSDQTVSTSSVMTYRPLRLIVIDRVYW